MKGSFDVDVSRYGEQYNFHVYGVSSINEPCNNTVMFLMTKAADKVNNLMSIRESILFVSEMIDLNDQIEENNLVLRSKEPRTEYCRFFKDNGIRNLPKQEDVDYVNGATIAKSAVVPASCVIMPGAYIGGAVVLGENVYIGSGARLVGTVTIGSDVVIRENAVIGADGLRTDRYEDGFTVTMPHFGGVRIEDNVDIGANTVIARGAIDDTIIEQDCRIDNNCFLSHGVHLHNSVLVVGETIMFGSSSCGEKTLISGNATIRNGVSIGKGALVGMGAVVTKCVNDNSIVLGNPAKEKQV